MRAHRRLQRVGGERPGGRSAHRIAGRVFGPADGRRVGRPVRKRCSRRERLGVGRAVVRRAPATEVPALLVSVKVIVPDCTASLNVALGVDDTATPVALEAGVWELTAGCSGRW